MRAWLMLLLVMPMGIAAAELPLIGKTMPPYPEGLREVGGICLADPGNPGAVCDHSIALLADASIDPGAAAVMRYVVAGRMQGRDGTVALWKITDALPYPAVAQDYFWQAGSCRLDRVEDGKVIAVVRHDLEQEYSRDVVWARRLELKSGRFLAVEPERVDCLNEGYGLGP